MEIVRAEKTAHGYRKSDAIEKIAQRFERHKDRFAALQIAAKTLYGETQRLNRKDGLRDGYDVDRNGQIFNVALLDQTFHEARQSVRRELLHAGNAAKRAEWDRYLVGVCEERARERGLDPDVTQLHLCEFVDEDEARALYRAWQDEAA